MNSQMNAGDTVDEDKIDNMKMMVISRSLDPKEWKNLGRYLGLRDTTLKHTEYDQRFDGIEETIYQMLVKWKEAEGSGATKERLIKGLQGIWRLDIIREVFYNETSNSNVNLDIALKENDLAGTITKVKDKLRQTYKGVKLPPTIWKKNKKMSLEELYMDLTLQENAEEDKPREITVKDVYFDREKRKLQKRILVEAAPGFGKSTLINKFLFDWSKEKDYIDNLFVLVFVIRLRDFDGNIKNALLKQMRVEGEHRDKQQNILQELQPFIALFLDGFDEINDSHKKKLVPLLKSELYPSMTVLITSRSGFFHVSDDSDVRDNIEDSYNRIAIQGIPEGKREEFLRKYLKNVDKSKFQKFSYLYEKDFSDLCRCPLFLHLLGSLIEEGMQKKITTKTELYKELFNFLLRRCVQKNHTLVKNVYVRRKILKRDSKFDVFHVKSQVFGTLNKWIAGTAKYFNGILVKLGKFSLEKLETNCLFFEKEEILKNCNNDKTILEMGIFSKNVNPENSEKTYLEPVHKTFMEFLAAVYLANLSTESNSEKFISELDELLKKKIEPDRYTLLFSFLFGLVGEKAGDILYTITTKCSIHKEALTDIFKETKHSKEVLEHLRPFIPLHYVVEEENSLLLTGTNMGYIESVEFFMNYDVDFDWDQPVDRLIVHTIKANEEGINSLMEKPVKCKHLVCYVHYKEEKGDVEHKPEEKSWKKIAKAIASIKADKRTFYINNLHRKGSFYYAYKEMLHGTWKSIQLDRLVLNINYITNEDISMLMSLLKENKITNGLFIKDKLHKVSAVDHRIDVDEAVMKTFANCVKESILEEFCCNFVLNDKSPIGICPSLKYLKLSKLLYIEGDSDKTVTFPLESIDVSNSEVIPSENQKGLILSESQKEVILRSGNLKELCCEVHQLQDLFENSEHWIAIENIQTLSLHFSSAIKNDELFTNLHKMKSLTRLILDIKILENNFLEKGVFPFIFSENSKINCITLTCITNSEIKLLKETFTYFTKKVSETPTKALEEMKLVFEVTGKIDVTDKIDVKKEDNFFTRLSIFLNHKICDKISIICEDNWIYGYIRKNLKQFIHVDEVFEQESLMTISIFNYSGTVVRKLISTK